MNTPFFTKVLLILKDYCDKEHGGNMRAASRALGLDPETGVLFRWLQCLKENPKNKRAPNLETVGPCMDHIGVLLLAPEEERQYDPCRDRPSQGSVHACSSGSPSGTATSGTGRLFPDPGLVLVTRHACCRHALCRSNP